VSTALKTRGGDIWGLPLMKFTLTYDGPLPSSGNTPKKRAKWDIRKHFHPQLLDLWASHPGLQEVDRSRHFPRGGGIAFHDHHSSKLPTPEVRGDVIDLCAPISKDGLNFQPLIRESFALHCGLKITFLRQEPPGAVYQGGDLDGRLKTLLDALAMPQHAQQVIHEPDLPDPIHCLMEDDSMISGLEIESRRLLAGSAPADYARIFIEVDVRARETRSYNLSFLG